MSYFIQHLPLLTRTVPLVWNRWARRRYVANRHSTTLPCFSSPNKNRRLYTVDLSKGDGAIRTAGDLSPSQCSLDAGSTNPFSAGPEDAINDMEVVKEELKRDGLDSSFVPAGTSKHK